MSCSATRWRVTGKGGGRGLGPQRMILLVSLILAGCSGPRPAGEPAERARLEESGRPFRLPHEKRTLPVLAQDASLADVLNYAFLSNAGLEQSWFEWRMALERFPQMTSLDDPRLSFEHLFSKESMTNWDRTTLGVSQMIPAPGKLELAGKMAFEEAVAAGRRFEDMKFVLQAEVVAAWSNLVLVDRRIAIDTQNVELLRDAAQLVRSEVSVGRASQAEASKAELEIAMAQNALEMARADRPPMLAMLNARLSRPSDFLLRPSMSEIRVVLPGDDAAILALAAERSPDLAAMAAEVRGREDALALAKKAWLPDLEIGFDVMGNVERTLMAAINVPLRRDRINAAIEESRAGIRAAQAALRERANDVRAQVVLQLYMARDSDRQVALLRHVLLPRALEVTDAVRAAYGTGSGSFLELLDAQRSLLELQRMQAEVEAARATAVARLEALCALDFGTIGHEEAGAR